MEVEGGKREQDKWWKRWNTRNLEYLAASCALVFVLLAAYLYYAFPNSGLFNIEIGFGGAVVVFFLGFFVFLMNEHVKSRQRTGEQVRF